MQGEGFSRRSVLKSAAGIFACTTCAQAGTVAAETTPQTTDSESTCSCECHCETGLPDDVEWKVLNIPGEPLSVRYVEGYRTDAEWIKQLTIQARKNAVDAWEHELAGPVTVDIYPDTYFAESHDSMAYTENTRSIRMVTPSDYAGSREGESTEVMRIYYLHGITHEYFHAPQTDIMPQHEDGDEDTIDFPHWVKEGFVEGLTVYHTDSDIQDKYHTREDAARMQSRVKNGYGYLMMMNLDIFRGSMQVFRYLFDEYGIETVAGIFSVEANHFLHAIEKQLGVTPLQLQADWLAYAASEYGGDYTDAYQELDVDMEAIANESPTEATETSTDQTTTSNESGTEQSPESEENDPESGGVAGVIGGGVAGTALGGAAGYALGSQSTDGTSGDGQQE